MRLGVMVILAAGLLAGCGFTDGLAGAVGFGSNRVRTDQTVPYKATLTASREDKRQFVVSTKEVALPLTDLRESLRYPATRYCIKTYGGSDVEWARETATGEWLVVSGDGALQVTGRCTAR